TPHLDAQEEWHKLLDQDANARKTGDTIARLQIALRYQALTNDGGNAILSVAHAYSVLKDSTSVFASLTAYAKMGHGSKAICNGDDKKFAWLANSPGFAKACRLIQANRTPIRRAARVLHFPDTGYLAEDIDYDHRNHSFLFTSILKHSIFRLTWDG